MTGRVDLLVVGAGAAGCVVAARAAEAGLDVVVLEAGGRRASRRACVLDVGPDSEVVARYPAELDGRTVVLPRGRTVGGSGAVNGGYCSATPPADLAGWGPDWPRRYAVGLARAAERLRPRLVPADPVARWVSAAFPGRGVDVAQARHGDRRVTAADAWDPAAAGARVLTGAPVRELRWAGGHAGGTCDGVVLADGREFAAREVVLCAGALGTAALLLRSGIGPATGHPVGRRTEEHPEVLLDLDPGVAPATTVRESAPDPGQAPPALLSRVVRLPVPVGGAVAEVEVRPYSVPLHRAIPGLAPQPHRIGIALMTPAGRGELRPDTDPDPGPDPAAGGGLRVVLDAHPDPVDAAALAAATGIVCDRLGLAGEPVASTSQHLSGSARMGEVVDDAGRVLGVAGLRVADASVLPALPRRGPYYTVLAVAEDLAAHAIAGRA